MARTGNSPKRRIAAADRFGETERKLMANKLKYVGSAMHKRTPGDYGFQPPTNPRPWKSLCDKNRAILLNQAEALLRDGILKGMISDHFDHGQPKYIWSVDSNGIPYEAKIGSDGYHGYQLELDDDMAKVVLDAWGKR